MMKQKYMSTVLFSSVFFILLLQNPHATHADCVTDWITQNPIEGSLTSQELSDIQCIFDWFETALPDVFYPAANTFGYGPLAFRYYAGSYAFLAAWKTTSLKIVYIGPLSANCVMELGTVDFWKKMVCNANAGITPGLWTGNNVQFFVSSDGTKITSTGSSIVKDGKAYYFVLGPNTFSNVGSCGSVNLTINISGDDVFIQNNTFDFTTNEGTRVEGEFSSGVSSSGTYSVNLYIPACGGYAVGSGAWSATPSGPYLSIESDGQSNHDEIVIENTVGAMANP